MSKRHNRSIQRAIGQTLESLEPRQLLAAFATLSGGTLSMVGDSGNNTLIVKFSGTKIQAQRDGQTLSFNKSDVKRLNVDGKSGNDKIQNLTSLPATLLGGSGKDTFVSGSGDDSIDGGADDDTLDYSGRSTGIYVDFLIGADASETAVAGTVAFVEDEGDRIAGLSGDEHDNLSGIQTIIGTSVDDAFDIGAFSSGSASLHFASVTFDAGNGHNQLRTAALNKLTANHPIVTYNGGSGLDEALVVGLPVNLNMGGGSDEIDVHGEGENAAPDLPNVDMGTGNNDQEFYISADNGTFHVGKNADIFEGPAGTSNMFIGTNGNDFINVTSEHATILGNDGNDTIAAGGYGDATIDGGKGNDTYLLSYITNPVTYTVGEKSGEGTDTLDLHESQSALKVDLSKSSGTFVTTANNKMTIKMHSSGQAANFENVIGSNFADSITGNNANNNLAGGKGNDTIKGNAGDDVIHGGDGNDNLTGGSGHDQLFGENNDDSIFAKDGQKDSVNGGSGTDTAQVDAIDVLSSIEHKS